ncbi:hypothetical protein F4780DRAFT_194665 [Xylariomycetidae sp. FL0641]|nr:hypothetical protein F4780DRAFT_194665 [Xylariomycetidae sp. FL0641]
MHPPGNGKPPLMPTCPRCSYRAGGTSQHLAVLGQLQLRLAPSTERYLSIYLSIYLAILLVINSTNLTSSPPPQASRTPKSTSAEKFQLPTDHSRTATREPTPTEQHITSMQSIHPSILRGFLPTPLPMYLPFRKRSDPTCLPMMSQPAPGFPGPHRAAHTRTLVSSSVFAGWAGQRRGPGSWHTPPPPPPAATSATHAPFLR